VKDEPAEVLLWQASNPNARDFRLDVIGKAYQSSALKPVSKGELAEIRIDITVLSPMELVDDPLALEVGKHGLYVAAGEKRGVLLPQVATQYRWDIKTFLEQTCLKAGLRKNAWKDSDLKVSGFTALIIEERP